MVKLPVKTVSEARKEPIKDEQMRLVAAHKRAQNGLGNPVSSGDGNTQRYGCRGIKYVCVWTMESAESLDCFYLCGKRERGQCRKPGIILNCCWWSDLSQLGDTHINPMRHLIATWVRILWSKWLHRECTLPYPWQQFYDSWHY